LARAGRNRARLAPAGGQKRGHDRSTGRRAGTRPPNGRGGSSDKSPTVRHRESGPAARQLRAAAAGTTRGGNRALSQRALHQRRRKIAAERDHGNGRQPAVRGHGMASARSGARTPNNLPECTTGGGATRRKPANWSSPRDTGAKGKRSALQTGMPASTPRPEKVIPDGGRKNAWVRPRPTASNGPNAGGSRRSRGRPHACQPMGGRFGRQGAIRHQAKSSPPESIPPAPAWVRPAIRAARVQRETGRCRHCEKLRAITATGRWPPPAGALKAEQRRHDRGRASP